MHAWCLGIGDSSDCREDVTVVLYFHRPELLA